jgi:putative transposase
LQQERDGAVPIRARKAQAGCRPRTVVVVARVPRAVLPDGVTHVFTRGNRYEQIYLAEGDAFEFLSRAEEAFRRFGIDCWAYCLMPTHYHFILDGRRDDFSRALHRLNGPYARWFNKEHGFRHHLFGDRFGAREILDEPHLLEAVRYIVLNPVRAGLCRHPREWRWSSYRATIGVEPAPPFLKLDWMREFISPEGFAAYVEAAMTQLDDAA